MNMLRIAEIGLCVAATVQMALLPNTIGRAVARRVDPSIAKLDATLDNIQDTTASANGLIKQISKDYRDGDHGLYWDIAASLESSTAASRVTEEMLEDIRPALFGGLDTRGESHAGLFPVATVLIEHFRNDIDRFTNSADATLQPLKETLGNLANLTKRLDQEIQEGSPKVELTIDLLNKSLADLDQMLADPNIQRTLANVEGSTESVDIALRPWRKHAGLLKTVLMTALKMIKVDPTAW